MAFDAILWAKLKSSASLVGGKVPSEQLPSYVDEVIEVASYSDLPRPGAAGKIYYTLDLKESYRWGSSDYILVNSVNKEALAKSEDVINLKSEIESTYAKKTELNGLASESFVIEKIAEIKIPEVDLSGYYKKTETYSATQTDEKISAAIAAIEFPETDLTGYATEQFVKAEISKIEIPDLSEYAKRSELPTVISAFTNDSGYITATALSGYATEAFVADEIAKIDIKDLDLSEYAKSSEIPKAVSQLENDLGFINSQALDGFVDAEYVSNEISSAVADLATADQLAAKADDILFTSDMIVGNALGGFSQGENVKNMTLKTIVEKLLKLSAPIVDTDITVNNIKPSHTYINGKLTSIDNSQVITDKGLVGPEDEVNLYDSASFNQGVFSDTSGNIGYQVAFDGFSDASSNLTIYIDPKYKVTSIEKWNPLSKAWQTSNDAQGWIWEDGEDGSPKLETVNIDGEAVQMQVYTWWVDEDNGYGPLGADTQWRFVVALAD